jgi:hypothetical protein
MKLACQAMADIAIRDQRVTVLRSGLHVSCTFAFTVPAAGANAQTQ